MQRIFMTFLASLCLYTHAFAQAPVSLRSTDPLSDYTDLMPLKPQLATATVIGAGEGTHGSREFFRMKHRLFRFLAEELGFTVFAIEDSPVGAALLQRFIETGDGNPIAVIKEHFHTVYQVTELSDLVYWMRQYNLQHGNKLRFAGFDCQQLHFFHQELTGLSQRYGLHDFDPLLDYSADTSVPFAKAMEPIVSICDSLRKALPPLREGVPAEDWRLARFYVDNIFAAAREFATQASDWARSFNIRDSMMARNVRWIGERYKGEKMMLWAHNTHLGNAYADTMFTFRPMGAHLRDAYGKKYRNIAMLTGAGTYTAQQDMRKGLDSGHIIAPPVPGSVDAQLQGLRIPLFLLPLRKSAISGRLRTIGTMASDEQFTHWPVRLREQFDWVFFAERTSSAQPL